jgi:hypothetical protein
MKVKWRIDSLRVWLIKSRKKQTFFLYAGLTLMMIPFAYTFEKQKGKQVFFFKFILDMQTRENDYDYYIRFYSLCF